MRTANSGAGRGTSAPIASAAVIAARITVCRNRLYPPRCGWRFFDNEAVEKTYCLRQTFFGRHKAVLMFDREYIIVTEHAQRGDEFTPPFGIVSIPAGTEDPRAITLIGVLLGIQNAGYGQISAIYLGVFGVHVKDRIPEDANGCDRIDTLPEHV